MKKTILVEFTDAQGKSVFINPAKISAIEEIQETANGDTHIVYSDGIKYGLNKTTFDKIMKHCEVIE